MKKDKFPMVSVIIPVAPGKDAKTPLKALKKVDYPKNKIEIFVVQGKNPSMQRNKCIEKAQGQIILFLDDDSRVSPEYFTKMLKHHERYDVIGGPALTLQSDTFMQKCFGYILGSYFATQKMQAKFRDVGKLRPATEKELILCNLSIKKSVLDKFGYFNERLYPNEENEMINRFQANGIKAVYDPQLPIYRGRRPTLIKFMKQLLNYGRGRMEHFRSKPSYTSIIFFIPMFFVFYLVSLIFIPFIEYLIPLILYIGLDLAFSIGIALRTRNIKTLLIVPLLFPLVHISYGIGILKGMFSKKREKRNAKIKIQKAKWR